MGIFTKRKILNKVIYQNEKYRVLQPVDIIKEYIVQKKYLFFFWKTYKQRFKQLNLDFITFNCWIPLTFKKVNDAFNLILKEERGQKGYEELYDDITYNKKARIKNHKKIKGKIKGWFSAELYKEI